MSLFNTLNTLAKSLGDVTSDALEGNNVGSKLSKERAERADILAEIGGFYYEQYQEGAQFDGVILDFMKRADVHTANIQNLESQLSGLNNRNQRQGVKCNSCGSINSEGNKFCRECGGNLILEPAPMKNCPSCGVVVANESAFCGECGTKIE
ncbi:zinc ribbon domain-containing protein [Fusibacter ferrireducens]|uniref:Zinc ribbon domain-containing protein n=1 Tax=Fusibacter ferrireducens TaxID=2785058 RepID=A0ABR9ZT66_9FIRM|nr:zinc ribbon domain-containing protein [Fusibacter ferrireducens]MBF4693333.1 zinc ribbon domain-containing protein [Fusibacter ferrireducens]